MANLNKIPSDKLYKLLNTIVVLKFLLINYYNYHSLGLVDYYKFWITEEERERNVKIKLLQFECDIRYEIYKRDPNYKALK